MHGLDISRKEDKFGRTRPATTMVQSQHSMDVAFCSSSVSGACPSAGKNLAQSNNCQQRVLPRYLRDGEACRLSPLGVTAAYENETKMKHEPCRCLMTMYARRIAN
eukprot:TRINITY_DN10219_c0_g1_i1.p2 TRINITY_DN10219_c0_g1~~TRINITY_DN10219_c0_g1_i1.p2  ORF type:complete len:106 (-),score=7.05 TRINITY_DN10219_c0_g1_i1:31-348(-)